MDKTTKSSAASRTIEREGSIWGLYGRFCLAQGEVLTFGLVLQKRFDGGLGREGAVRGLLGADLSICWGRFLGIGT